MKKMIMTCLLSVAVAVMQAQQTNVQEVVYFGKPASEKTKRLSPAELKKKNAKEERRLRQLYKKDSISNAKQTQRMLKPREDSIIKQLKAGKSVEESGLLKYVSDNSIISFFVNRFIDKRVMKVVRKSPEKIVGVAKCYYQYQETPDRIVSGTTYLLRSYNVLDTVTAFNFIRKAIDVNPMYAGSYVLAADILDYDGKTEDAMAWLKRGFDVNPKDTLLYIAEARILGRTDIETAKAKLAEAKRAVPSFNENRHIARLYDEIDIYGTKYRAEVAHYYGEMDMNDLSQAEAETMVFSFYYSGQPDLCSNYAERLLKRFPKSLSLNRFRYRALNQLKQYPEAMEAFENLKHAETTAPDVSAMELVDSVIYINVLAGVKKYDEATSLYETIMAITGLEGNTYRNADYYFVQMMSDRVKDYIEKEEYERAVDLIKPIAVKRKAEGKLNDVIVSSYASVYRSWSTILEGDEKKNMLMKADSIYAEGQATSELNKDLFLYNRFFIRFSLDPEIETDEVLPFAQQLIEMLEPLESRDRGQTARLLMGYEYLMRYEFFRNHNKKTAIAVAEKILDIAPDHQAAKQFVSILSK